MEESADATGPGLVVVPPPPDPADLEAVPEPDGGSDGSTPDGPDGDEEE
ncbi:MAG: hypothetical protein HY049_02395, partial [Acidobacteria bacterium]|nr:hypothetical protein [Acidobacteriota bacterium]